MKLLLLNGKRQMENNIEFKLLLNNEPYVVWNFLIKDKYIKHYNHPFIIDSSWKEGELIRIFNSSINSSSLYASGIIKSVIKEKLLVYDLKYADSPAQSKMLRHSIKINDLVGSTEFHLIISGLANNEDDLLLADLLKKEWQQKLPLFAQSINQSSLL